MLYLIGLGLGDPTDITEKGHNAIKKCDDIYLEAYTSVLSAGQDALVCKINFNNDIQVSSHWTIYLIKKIVCKKLHF